MIIFKKLILIILTNIFFFASLQDDDDDDDFSGPALGGRVGVRSDSDDEDEPPTMRNSTSIHNKQTHLSVPIKKQFRMEVVDF